MTAIEHRVEADGVQPDYSGKEFTADQIAAGEHRQFVGGVWDSHGKRQVDYLIKNGLQPSDKLVDVGCGCLRAGRLLVDYLDPGNYYGVDANHSLIQAGYDVELTDEQRSRLPAGNLRANDRFDVDFGTQFDIAIAQSVFTHISLNHIRLCLYRVAKSVRPGGTFYATFFARDRDTPLDRIIAPHKPKPFFTEKNVFWYYPGDIEWAASFSPWKFTYVGEWGHPAHQKMAKFTRLSDEEWAAARSKAKSSQAGRPAKSPAKPAAGKPVTGKPAATKPAPAAAARKEPLPPLRDELRRMTVNGLRWAARRLDR